MPTTGTTCCLVSGHGPHGQGFSHGIADDLGVLGGGTGGRVGRQRLRRSPPALGEGVPEPAAQHVRGDALADGGLALRVDLLVGQQAAGSGEYRIVAGDALGGGAVGLGTNRIEVRCLGRRRCRGRGCSRGVGGHGRIGLLASGSGGRRGVCRVRHGRLLGADGIGDDRLDGRDGRGVTGAAHGGGRIDRQGHNGDFVRLPIDSAVDGTGDGIRDRLVAVHAVADADAAQSAIRNPLPERFDIGRGRELQGGDAAATFEARGDHASHDVAGITTAVGVEHWGPAITQPLHAHRIRRHVEFLGDQAERWDEVAGTSACGPNDLDRASRAVDGGRRSNSASRGNRLPISGKSVGMRCRQRGIAPAQLNGLGHIVCLLGSVLVLGGLSLTAMSARALKRS